MRLVLILLICFSLIPFYFCFNCSSRLPELENALYQNGQNQLNLESAFFPLFQQPTRFIRVAYVFTDGDPNDSCEVSYYWSVGSFLFIQPPSVFRFTSLFFNFPANIVENVTLILPNDCRPLVTTNNSEECSCETDQITSLDVITRYVSVLYNVLVLYP